MLYRLYLLTSNGDIAAYSLIEADTDADAISRANLIARERAFRLVEGMRVVFEVRNGALSGSSST